MPVLTSLRFFALGRQASSALFYEYVASRGASNIDKPDRARSVRMIRPEPLARIGAGKKEHATLVERAVDGRTNPRTLMPPY